MRQKKWKTEQKLTNTLKRGDLWRYEADPGERIAGIPPPTRLTFLEILLVSLDWRCSCLAGDWLLLSVETRNRGRHWYCGSDLIKQCDLRNSSWNHFITYSETIIIANLSFKLTVNVEECFVYVCISRTSLCSDFSWIMPNKCNKHLTGKVVW